jgi:hypothetical protein
MANPRWSASRLSTYKTCKLRYLNQYISEFFATGQEGVEVQQKGLVAHDIAEWLDSTKSYDELVAYAKQAIGDADFDAEKYPILKAMPRLYRFWEKRVKALEAIGFTTQRECWEHPRLFNEEFTGAIDLILHNPSTGEVVIYDYKTGKTAKISEDYQTQLTLYAVAVGQRLGYDIPTIVAKTKCYLFFPLSGVTDDEATDSSICERNMLKAVKELKLSEKLIDDTLESIQHIVDDSNTRDWSTVGELDGDISFACSWCPYLASTREQSDDPSFIPCTATLKQGLESPGGTFARKTAKGT